MKKEKVNIEDCGITQYQPKVYLAGKITNNWWRDEILGIDAQHRTNGASQFDADVDGNLSLYFDEEYNADSFIYTGPHSLACDHRCYHNEKRGAKHTANGIYWENVSIPRPIVKKACCHQIDKSDFVFAYIDSLDCYGTIAELGYAYGKGKYISILFKTKKLANELWFVAQMANKYVCGRKIKPYFTETINDYYKHKSR